MLRGDEHFYSDWADLVRSAIGDGHVVDLGTPESFRKEMAILESVVDGMYITVDYVASPDVDLVADAHTLPFRDRSVGTVVCSHLLEHVADPRVVINEVFRVLQPDGHAYFSFLVDWPYHGSAGLYHDFWRFKRDTIDLLLEDWAHYDVLRGGGPMQVLVNLLPGWSRPVTQRVANLVDRRTTRSMTPAYYVVARR